MRITALRIENFRSIKQLQLELGETTVFVGPNNAGKTAILDALRIALPLSHRDEAGQLRHARHRAEASLSTAKSFARCSDCGKTIVRAEQ
jgi:recombinational DNA repair ATPase RecF